MSNQLYIESTEFKPLNGSATFGYRIYDNYDAKYSNSSASMIVDDMELVELAKDEFPEFFEYLIEAEQGVTVNGVYYESSELFNLEETDEIQAIA